MGRILKSYLFWTYDRGSFHYDVIVTVILAFIFLAPRFIDFKDQPAGPLLHPNSIAVTDVRMYQVEASAVDAQDLSMVRANFERVLRPIAGAVSLDGVEPVHDGLGHVVAYRGWVRK